MALAASLPGTDTEVGRSRLRRGSNYQSRKHPNLVAIHLTKMMDARVSQASVRSLRKLGCYARA
jgi:hypothetical protein